MHCCSHPDRRTRAAVSSDGRVETATSCQTPAPVALASTGAPARHVTRATSANARNPTRAQTVKKNKWVRVQYMTCARTTKIRHCHLEFLKRSNILTSFLTSSTSRLRWRPGRRGWQSTLPADITSLPTRRQLPVDDHYHSGQGTYVLSLQGT